VSKPCFLRSVISLRMYKVEVSRALRSSLSRRHSQAVYLYVRELTPTQAMLSDNIDKPCLPHQVRVFTFRQRTINASCPHLGIAARR